MNTQEFANAMIESRKTHSRLRSVKQIKQRETDHAMAATHRLHVIKSQPHPGRPAKIQAIFIPARSIISEIDQKRRIITASKPKTASANQLNESRSKQSESSNIHLSLCIHIVSPYDAICRKPGNLPQRKLQLKSDNTTQFWIFLSSWTSQNH